MAKKGKQEPEKLYGVYRNGVRVYLPPKGHIGLDRRRAEVVRAGLPGSELVCVYDPEKDDAE